MSATAWQRLLILVTMAHIGAMAGVILDLGPAFDARWLLVVSIPAVLSIPLCKAGYRAAAEREVEQLAMSAMADARRARACPSRARSGAERRSLPIYRGNDRP